MVAPPQAQSERRLVWHPRQTNRFVVGGGSQIVLYEWSTSHPGIRHVTSRQDSHMRVGVLLPRLLYRLFFSSVFNSPRTIDLMTFWLLDITTDGSTYSDLRRQNMQDRIMSYLVAPYIHSRVKAVDRATPLPSVRPIRIILLLGLIKSAVTIV